MARIVTKIGNVFSVKINEKETKYFQYVANDLTQLNSSVMRAFSKVYQSGERPNLEEIVNGEVDFHAHCILSLGIRMGLWEKVGKANISGTVNPFFKHTNDYGIKIGETPVRVSENWYVWRINEEMKFVGRLIGENQKAEIGIVINPLTIVEMIQTGKGYNFKNYPHYE